MRALKPDWNGGLLAAVLACAIGAAGQTETAKLTDISSGISRAMPHSVSDGPAPAVSGVATAPAPNNSNDVVDAPDTRDSRDTAAAPDAPTSGNALVKTSQPETRASERFQWKPALGQAVLYTAVMDGWRFSHEPGTRDATGYGPWFNDWIHSIGETRGWDDGDGWHASYVGHPFEGAIFGFIQQQNDPLYRKVEWGDGRVYWMSRLRALAFSAIMSTQWTLGPVSEASLGNVQLHASPGFIDLVNTPLLGIGEMMGEDMIDRYFLTHVENHTANPWLIMVTRSLGNPTRSFANMMAFKQPWHRENRPGLFGEYRAERKQLVREYKDGEISAPYGPHTAAERALLNKDVENVKPLAAPIELNAYSLYESFLGGGSCIGAGGSGAARVNPAFQIVAEVNGCLVINMPKNQSGDSTMFGVGPRWTPMATHRFSPFAELIFGGRRITHEIQDPVKRKTLIDEWAKNEIPHFPMRSAYEVEYQALGFAMTASAGFDAVFGRAWAWRVLDVGYSHSWLPAVDPINASQGVQIRSGLVLRIGTW
ncbi:MAG: hypothetical protein P4M04_15145 [Acidobacteriota bacterium]|nr:hypothetical protein [Acidobacteriota bacterium]